tara:strand:+ start:9611 stop:10372 length:762 start_codon:yes stop_codon:yes gene_type:complete
MTSDPKKFIQEIKIKHPDLLVETLSTESATENVSNTQPEGYINNKSLVSFASTVSSGNRQDVLNSTLIAQLYADHKFTNQEDIVKWYEAYVELLSNVGWSVETAEFSNLNAKGSVFEMQSAILDIIGTAISGSLLGVVMKTLEALKSLSDSDSKLIVFEKNTHSLNKGSFQIALADENNGAVSMTLGVFHLSTSTKIDKIIFFKSGKDKTEVNCRTTTCTLNSEIYSLVRNEILNKLGKNAEKYISKLPDFSL